MEAVDLTGLSAFFTSLLEAWEVLKVDREPAAIPGQWKCQEPLFHNCFINASILTSVSISSVLREADCVKLGHLTSPTNVLSQNKDQDSWP